VIENGWAELTVTSPPAVTDTPVWPAAALCRSACSVVLRTYTLAAPLMAALPPAPSEAATEVMSSPPEPLALAVTLTLPLALIEEPRPTCARVVLLMTPTSTPAPTEAPEELIEAANAPATETI